MAQALASNRLTDEAVRVLEAGVKRLGPIPSLQLKILEVEVSAGRYDSALSRLDAMQRSGPRPEPWMEKRASILAQASILPAPGRIFRHSIQRSQPFRTPLA